MEVKYKDGKCNWGNKTTPTSRIRPTPIKLKLTYNYAHKVKIVAWLAICLTNHGPGICSYEYKLGQSGIIDKTPNPIKSFDTL